MSLLAVQGGATGTGTVTLLAPVTNTDRTLTLPDATGTVALQGGAGVGKVLQVVNAALTVYTSTSTSTFIDTGVTATITPQFATSKILVFIDHSGCSKETNNTGLQIKVLRGSTQIIYLEDLAGNTASSATNFIGTVSTNYLDSPATTSATTYKSQFASRANSAVVSIGNYGSVPVTSTITLMEIAA